MNASDRLRKNIFSSIEAKKALLECDNAIQTFNSAVEKVINCYKKGGRLYIAGNGGSAADAQHLAAEFVSKLAKDRAPLPAEALTVDSSILTAVGNDYGYEYVFSRQLEAKASSRDVFLGITTSGQSHNILKAIEACKRLNVESIVFCGKDGGLVKGLTDNCIVVPGSMTSTIQEIHIVLAHTLCECVEAALFE
ncbi:SIS domain-containing protein [Chromobacterium sp. IIBBL 290-4]|uniref:D-sedoheptulose-7-phosphate isomerase n=1 Tax=Chromobacterium sp. IIBBL 290-4 TaxID=2953890 RepID=UPI0020B8C992|nr:SIS domain-containing protein [Chromobacterium sp. IIBBL 290-4]UTH72839.1 SIS domain-containing protein [Chromobacterium sp. IIBBL 290-4]